ASEPHHEAQERDERHGAGREVAGRLAPGAAAHWAWQVLLDGGTWSEAARNLATSAVAFVTFLGFVVGLGRGLLSVDRPSWRLPPVSDALAARIAYFPWAAVLVIAAIWLPTKVNALVQASLAAVVATHVLTALAVTALATVMLLRLRRIPVAAHGADASGARAPADGRPPERADEPERPVWVGLVMGAVALAVIAVWLLLAFGFVALASFLAGQLVWSGVVAAAAYLLFKLADDLSMALLSSRGSSGQKLRRSFDLAPQTLDQAAVLLSGLARIAIFFFTLTAFLAPLGTGLDELFQRSGKLGSSFRIGEFQLVPGAIFGAATVLVLGLIALRILKHWLDHSYLPSTTLEPGMRSSLTTLLGYVGGVLVIAFALSALGIGIERIAWVASALSVGIGFGLQAIVQNFISGLILLAERPVKVGDW
ncbi:MAG: mechanosensitive ion channel, partial [Comamonadaceae bacterium]